MYDFSYYTFSPKCIVLLFYMLCLCLNCLSELIKQLRIRVGEMDGERWRERREKWMERDAEKEERDGSREMQRKKRERDRGRGTVLNWRGGCEKCQVGGEQCSFKGVNCFSFSSPFLSSVVAKL